MSFFLHCNPNHIRKQAKGKETKTQCEKYSERNQNQDQKRNAVILKKERTGLVREKYYVVKEGGGIAVDHAAILAQAYELLKGRLHLGQNMHFPCQSAE